jgi:hypothetical protein
MSDERRATSDKSPASPAFPDIMGDGLIYPKLVLPDPDSGRKDCVLKAADGSCPSGCCECATFQLGMENWLRTRRMDEE